MDFEYPVHQAKSLKQAIALAQYLKQSGKFDIFRGQSQNYPLQPSIFRGPKDEAVSMDRLNQFSHWISQRQELSSLHSNKDAMLAVAQHYGIPTPFLDFTTEPEVAGFFASYSKHPARKRKNEVRRRGCIVCADRTTLRRSWQDMNARHRDIGHGDLVRVVEIDVRNLWRLQAQSGLFVDVRVDIHLLEMFSEFLHIEFPQKVTNDIESFRKYHPINKSHMELLLDQYFVVETYPEREKELLKIFTHKIVAGPLDFTGEPSSFLNNTYPPHHDSWSDETLRPWRNEPDEKYEAGKRSETEVLAIDLSQAAVGSKATLERQLMTILKNNDARKKQRLNWSVLDQCGVEARNAYDELNEEKSDRLVRDAVRLIFDGMRGKPYSNENIAAAIATYICFACFPAWETMEQMWGEVLGVEMDGADVRSRGFCGVDALTRALRPDFSSYLVPKEIDAFKSGGVREALGMLIVPSRMFVFDDFKTVFAEQIIPSIALERIEGDVFHFNAANLRVFGLS